jgi:hypothetical protein
MTVVGARNSAAFGAESDIAAWASTVALNPARIPQGTEHSTELDGTLDRLKTHSRAGLARLAELSGIEPS